MDYISRNILFDSENIFENSSENDKIFLASIKESLMFHLTNNVFFKTFLKFHKFDIKSLNNINDISKIPPIHAFLFKTHKIFTIKEKDSIAERTSSGTSGQKSLMLFCKDTAVAGQKMIINTMNYFNLIDNNPTNYVIFSHETEKDSSLGTANTDMMLTSFAPVNHVFCALPKGRNSNDFDVWGAIRAFRAFAKSDKPVRIFGLPQFLYVTLNKMEEISESPIKLSSNSLVLLGGGWKGYDDNRIDKLLFYKKINKQLGIPLHRCRDMYAALEHPLPYIECENHHFHEPIYSRVLIRDVKTLEVLPDDKLGFLNFISPHLLSAPANSIIMPDLAVKYPASKCGCRIDKPFFEVVGRSGVNKSRSCAISAMEILRGDKDVNN